MSNVYKVPILLILFNRPKYTLKTIQFLNMIKPEVLYVHIDGPRDQEDQDRIDEVELMLNDLHPDINVTFKKSDSNLGCGLGPVSAINWFFENEVEYYKLFHAMLKVQLAIASNPVCEVRTAEVRMQIIFFA